MRLHEAKIDANCELMICFGGRMKVCWCVGMMTDRGMGVLGLEAFGFASKCTPPGKLRVAFGT